MYLSAVAVLTIGLLGLWMPLRDTVLAQVVSKYVLAEIEAPRGAGKLTRATTEAVHHPESPRTALEGPWQSLGASGPWYTLARVAKRSEARQRLAIAHPVCGFLAGNDVIVAPEGTAQGTLTSTHPRLTLDITPAYQTAPGTVQLKVRVEPHAENRELCISIDGDTGYLRSSCWDLEGVDAPLITQTRYSGLPEGHYTATAEIKATSKVRAHASGTFTVI